MALVSRIDKIIDLLCKRALLKTKYSAKETYNSIDPTDRSHPIVKYRGLSLWWARVTWWTHDTFHWEGYIPEIHRIGKAGFFCISSYRFKLRFWFDLNLYRGIWVSRICGVLGWSILNEICYTMLSSECTTSNVTNLTIATSRTQLWEHHELASVRTGRLDGHAHSIIQMYDL